MLEPFELIARNLAIDGDECLWCGEGQLIMIDRQREIITKANKSVIKLAMLTDPRHEGDPPHANFIFMDENLKFRASIPVPLYASHGWYVGQDKYDIKKLGLTKDKWDSITEFIGSGKKLEILISHVYELFMDSFSWNSIYHVMSFLSVLTQSGFIASNNDSGVVFVNERVGINPY